jgi:predicted nucleic acid-binding protein
MNEKVIHGIIADSSFYLCFLDDIEEPDCLLKIISVFDFYIPPIVAEEIRISEREKLRDNQKIVRIDNYIDFGEILRPFLSQEIINKGEHEVIGLGYHFYQINLKFYLIVDEDEARDFIRENLPYLLQSLHGTVGLIGICHCHYNIFKKETTIDILERIDQSKFRISKDILNKIKREVKTC